MVIKKIAFVSYGLFLSAVIGLIAAVFLVLENFITEIIWHGQNHLVQTFVVLVGSVILYFLLKKWPNLPKTTHDSIKELKENQTIDYQDVFLNLLITIVILGFGAGVGPEAALLSAIISLSIWQADNLRYFYFNYEELLQLPLKQVFRRLLDPFNYRQKYNAQKAIKNPKLIKWKKILYFVFTVNGVLAFGLLIKQTDQPSFITKLGQTHWTWQQLWVVPVLLIIGIIVGKILKVAGQLFEKMVDQLNLSLAVKILLGALGIIVVAFFVPDLLFSGQHSLHLLVTTWSQKPALELFVLAFLKLIFLVWCLSLNWRGGNIFPITFAALTSGFAMAQLLNVDTLLVVAVFATVLMSELLSPIVAGIFLILFFPIQLSVIIILVAAIMWLKNKYLGGVI
jgi:H+/Cl- antiporter ClcA